MFLDFTLIFFFLLVLVNYRVQRSVLYPPFIFCAMWLLDLTLVRLNLIELDPVHGNTLAIVAAGAMFFSAGGILAGLVPRILLATHIDIFRPLERNTSDSLRNTLTIVLLCALPVMFYQVLQLSKAQGGGLNVLMQARLELIDEINGGESSLPVLIIGYISLYANLTALLFATGKRDRKYWTVTAVALFACILATGRTNILLLLSGLSTIYLLRTKKESLLSAARFLRWPLAAFLALFVTLIFTNKNTDGMIGGVAEIATFSIISYIVGPLAAFDGVVQNPSNFPMDSSHILEFPLHLASSLHLIESQPKMISSFVFVPFETNVYTIFRYYYLEFGTIGALVFFAFIGLVHSLLYLKARQGGRFSTYLFGYSVFTIVMVIFEDQYYLMAVYLRAITFGAAYFFIASTQVRLSVFNKQIRTSELRS